MVPFAYMPSPIPRQVRWKFVRSYIPPSSAFPVTGAGRLLHHHFRGLLSVYLRYGLHARQVAFATLCTRGFSSLVASCCSDCYRVERTSSRAGLPPLWTTAFFTAHPVSALARSYAGLVPRTERLLSPR